MPLGSRIRKRRKELGLTLQQLASKANVNSGVLGNVERRDQDNYDGAFDVARALGVRPAWLIKGEEPMLEDGKATQIMSAGKKMITASSMTNVAPARDLIAQVPLIGSVAAGNFKHSAELEHDQIERYISVQKDYKGLGFALRIEGDSMTSPTGRSYPDGAEAVFNAGNKCPNNGDLVLAKICGSDEVTFKKFVIDAGRPYLMPLNPTYARIDVEFIVLAVFEYAIVY